MYWLWLKDTAVELLPCLLHPTAHAYNSICKLSRPRVSAGWFAGFSRQANQPADLPLPWQYLNVPAGLPVAAISSPCPPPQCSRLAADRWLPRILLPHALFPCRPSNVINISAILFSKCDRKSVCSCATLGLGPCNQLSHAVHTSKWQLPRTPASWVDNHLQHPYCARIMPHHMIGSQHCLFGRGYSCPVDTWWRFSQLSSPFLLLSALRCRHSVLSPAFAPSSVGCHHWLCSCHLHPHAGRGARPVC